MKVKNYYKTIGKAVHEISDADKRWKWSWRSGGNGDTILLRWGYLETIGQHSDIEITYHEDGLERWLLANMNCDVLDDSPVVTIGPARWDDARTMEDAIPMMLREVARIAHARY